MTARVRRRRLHYFSGFDPRGARHYHRLFRDEAGKPQPHGGVVTVGRREKLSPLLSRWTVQWRAAPGAAETVETEHVFMSWDDIIRAHWSRNPLQLAGEFVGTYLYIFRKIGASRVRGMYMPAFKAGAFPLVVVFAPILVAAIATVAFGIGGALAGAALAAAVWWLAGRIGLPWILRIYTFFAQMGQDRVPELAGRTHDWVEAIVSAQQTDPVDEVLLVGHSVGTLVMVGAVDALLRDPRWQALQKEKPTALLTLGHSYQMVALAPEAADLRKTLARLANATALCWWDVSARIDPLCFYNLHPLAGTPEEASGPWRWPVLHNARFMPMYAPERWAVIRRDKLRAHFLYLATPEKPGNFSPYDVFYGPLSLAAQVAAKGGRPADPQGSTA